MAADDNPGGRDSAGEGGHAAGSRRGELRELFLLFTKLGFVAFGRPAAHVAMMRQEVVGQRGWMGDQEFLDLNGATNLIPVPNSTELAIHIGRERAGWRGLLVAGTCFIVPATLIVLAFAIAYGSTPAGQSLLYGITPVVIAVVAQALWGLSKTAVKGPLTAAVGAALLLYLFTSVPEIPLLFGAALLVFAAQNAGRWWGKAASVAPLGVPMGLLASAKAPVVGALDLLVVLEDRTNTSHRLRDAHLLRRDKQQIQEDVGTRPHFSPRSFSDMDEHVRQFIARVKSSPFVPNKDNVRGLVYAVETGRPREVLG